MTSVRWQVEGARRRLTLHVVMRARRKTHHLVAYAVVILVIVASFGWQMLHGICPVP